MIGLPRTSDLLQMSPAAGCGCKLPLQEMEDLMTVVDGMLGSKAFSRVKLDSKSRDDAGLYELERGFLLASSVDYGTPVSSDPVTWGRISALNALSDIYAMGATPLFALSIVGWPSGRPGRELPDLMSGALQTLTAENTQLLGGHTITSDVPLFGLSVTGQAHSDSVMLVSNAEADHYLLVTKPLGTGIITAAQKSSVASAEAIAESERIMLISNRSASRLAVQAGIRAATDITGYGLMGHLHNMLKSSGCAAELAYDSIPVIEAAMRALSDDGIVPNSAERNYMTLESWIDWSDTPLEKRFIMCDPQTSGGLLLSADEGQAKAYLALCAEAGIAVSVVGRVRAATAGAVTVSRHLPSVQRP